MGNTGGRERSQPPVDDSGPTVLQTRINYSSPYPDSSISARVWQQNWKTKIVFSYIANYASNNVDYFFNYLLKEIIDTDYRLIVFKEFVMD